MKIDDRDVPLYSLSSLSYSLFVWLWEVPKAKGDLLSLNLLIFKVEIMMSTWQGGHTLCEISDTGLGT